MVGTFKAGVLGGFCLITIIGIAMSIVFQMQGDNAKSLRMNAAQDCSCDYNATLCDHDLVKLRDAGTDNDLFISQVGIYRGETWYDPSKPSYQCTELKGLAN